MIPFQSTFATRNITHRMFYTNIFMCACSIAKCRKTFFCQIEQNLKLNTQNIQFVKNNDFESWHRLNILCQFKTNTNQSCSNLNCIIKTKKKHDPVCFKINNSFLVIFKCKWFQHPCPNLEYKVNFLWPISNKSQSSMSSSMVLMSI